MTNATLKWASRFLAWLVLVAAPSVLLAQTGRVTGTVTDSSSGQRIISATVSVVGKPNLAAITGPEGRFSISNVPAGPVQLRVQRLGYAPKVLSIAVQPGETQTINAALHIIAAQLNTVVVSIGYGEANQRDVTGAVSAVTTAALERSPVVSMDQILQGTSAGVDVTTASSEPGGALTVRIRGNSSITGNGEPLYVIDGFPIENDVEGLSVGSGGRSRTTPSNPLATLNPSDIESITVLKDASSTAIYGARGANGVVIITTKQGRGTKPVFTMDYSTGAASLAKKYKLLNAAQYMDYANTYGQASSTPFTPFPDSTKTRILGSGLNTDWQDLLFRTGANRNLQLTVRGASTAVNVTRYSLSGGYFEQDGIVIGSGIKRMSARVNVNQAIGTRVEFGGSLSASQARSKSTPTQGQQNSNAGAVSAAIQYVPILPVRRPDGSWTLINPDLNVYSSLLDAPQTPNPLSMAYDVTDSLSDTRILTNVFGQFELVDNLQLKVSLGTDYASRGRNTYYPKTTMRGAQTNGDAIRAASNATSWLNENILTYTRKFAGDQNMSLLAGYTRQRSDFEGSTMENTNFVGDVTGFNDIGVGAQAGGPNVSSRRSTQTLESYLARANYSLRDRYFFSGTIRRDGSSRFARNKKNGNFPSGSVAWRASNEPWMKDIKHLDDLKFRLSYGIVGNPSIRPYQSLARLNGTSYSFNGTQVGGYYPASVANDNLSWESTAQVDYGMDVAFLGRFDLTVDYYRKKTTDLLLQVSLPFETGFRDALANRGSVQNLGLEIGLNATILKAETAKAWSWKAMLNYASNRNKVLDLGGQKQIFASLLTTDYNLPGTLIQVGQPIGMFYGFKSSGVVRDSAAAAAITWKNFNNSAFKPGDMRVEDLDGDGVITLADRTVIGNPIPKFTMGLTNIVAWKGVELTALLQGVSGNKILNINRIRTESSPRANIALDRYLKAWSPTNLDAKYPRIGENPNQVGVNNFTDNLLDDGSYIRLRAVTVTYTLPDIRYLRSALTGARIFVTGNNLWTSTSYSGFDPDVSSQSVGATNRGIDIGSYPLAKSVSTGLSLTF
jgi:TonB-linked SusC/RagA family outer membrane protein